MDKVSIENAIFYGYHGTHPEERKLGQRFEVDLDLFGDFEAAAREDNLEKAANYVAAYERVKAIVEMEPHKLLEALALRLCLAVLDEFAVVEKVTVRIRKPSVPIAGALSATSVEFTRSRRDS